MVSIRYTSWYCIETWTTQRLLKYRVEPDHPEISWNILKYPQPGLAVCDLPPRWRGSWLMWPVGRCPVRWPAPLHRWRCCQSSLGEAREAGCPSPERCGDKPQQVMLQLCSMMTHQVTHPRPFGWPNWIIAHAYVDVDVWSLSYARFPTKSHQLEIFLAGMTQQLLNLGEQLQLGSCRTGADNDSAIAEDLHLYLFVASVKGFLTLR